MVGQGAGVNESRGFRKCDYDQTNISFVEAKAAEAHCMALTDKGELYGWGSNGSKRLGMSDTKDYFSPTKIPFFENYIVHEFHLGTEFSLVRASPKDDLSKSMIFHLGSIIGLSSDGVNDDGVLRIKSYDNINLKHIATGDRYAVFVHDGEYQASEGTKIHHGYTCDVTGKSPIVGTMHFYKDSDNKWHFLSKQGYDRVKLELPAICFATKYHIEDIQGKDWPEIDASAVLEETKDQCDPEYVAWTVVDGDNVLPRPKSNEVHIFETETHDINPIIFYRLARPLRDDSSLPYFDLTKYHKRTELFGIRVEADPDYSFQKNDIIMNIEYEKYMNIQAQIKSFNSKYDTEIQSVIEKYMKDNGVDFFECPFLFVMASDLDWSDKNLKAMANDVLQQRIDTLVLFNQHLLKAIPFALMDEDLIIDEEQGGNQFESESISASLILGKKYAFEVIKNIYMKKVSDALQTNYDCPYVYMKRAVIKKKYDEGKPDLDGDWTELGLITKGLKSNGYKCFKQNSSTSQPYHANYQDEGLDDSGTFRKSQSAIIEELHSKILPLFIPSNNQTTKTGDYQDRWVLNPSCNNPNQQDMYTCIGAFMGFAFRCGSCMNFKLAPVFWKKLLCESLTIEDIQSFDLKQYNLLKELEKLRDGSAEEFKDPNLKFCTTLSDGSVLELCADGEHKSVTHENIGQYIDLVVTARLTESNKQMRYINKGFDIVFPGDVMRFMPWEDVETRIRGQPVTVKKLKEISTYYSMSADDEWGTRFWWVLDQFEQEGKLERYLRYIWGRTRLPYEDKVRDQNHYINLKDNYYSSDHDSIFPDLYTYNFQMYFPRYSTNEIAKTKLFEHIETTEKYYMYGKGDDGEGGDNVSEVAVEESDESSDSDTEAPAQHVDQEAPRRRRSSTSSNQIANLFGGDSDY